MIALLLAAVVGCGGRPEPEPEVVHQPPMVASQPDLVLFAVLHWRAAAGEDVSAEAALTRPFGAASLSFSSAYSQSPSELVSLGSLVAGRYPSGIPTCAPTSELASSRDAPWCAAIPENRRTLPEVLGIYGYATALVAAGVANLSLVSGDFETVIELDAPGGRTDWDELSTKAASWWELHADRPRLLVVVVPDLVLEARRDELGLPAASEGRREQRIGGRSGSPERGSGGPGGPGGSEQDASPEVRERRELGEKLRTIYAREAEAVGTHLVALQQRLKSETRARWTVLFGLAGISLAEPWGYYQYVMGVLTNDRLLDRTIHVPLYLYGPKDAPRSVVSQPVELLDLFPTLADLGGAMAPVDLPGQSLFLADDRNVDAVAYAEFGDMLAVRKGAWLLSYRAFVHKTTSLDPAVTEALFNDPLNPEYFGLHDVVSDPLQRNHELSDRRRARTEVAADLRAEMIAIRTGPGSLPEGVLTPERLWKLRMARNRGYW